MSRRYSRLTSFLYFFIEAATTNIFDICVILPLPCCSVTSYTWFLSTSASECSIALLSSSWYCFACRLSPTTHRMTALLARTCVVARGALLSRRRHYFWRFDFLAVYYIFVLYFYIICPLLSSHFIHIRS